MSKGASRFSDFLTPPFLAEFYVSFVCAEAIFGSPLKAIASFLRVPHCWNSGAQFNGRAIGYVLANSARL